jgi:hypothetical protein
MKTTLKFGFSIILVLTLLLTATGAVLAAPLAGGPTVTPLTGAGGFTVTLVSAADLPGTVVNDAGTVLPAGFSEGEMRFSGDGVKVSGLSGSASLCMPLADYQYGWHGSIYQWLNGKWTALATTTTPDTESASATVCTVIYGDGTYALLVSYKQPATTGKVEACTVRMKNAVFASYDVEGMVGLEEARLMSDFDIKYFPVGARFKYKVVNEDPTIPLGGDLSGYMTVTSSDMSHGFLLVEFSFPDGTVVTYSGEGFPDFVVRVYLPGCYSDFHVSEPA